MGAPLEIQLLGITQDAVDAVGNYFQTITHISFKRFVALLGVQ